MPRYKKGANAERELIKLLFERGFAVVRVAGSGATSLPCPDVVALRQGKLLAIECKAWKQEYLSIAIGQMNELSNWSNTAGAEMYIAWKLPNKGWFFLLPEHFKKSKKFYIISQNRARKQGLSLDIITGQQSQIPFK